MASGASGIEFEDTAVLRSPLNIAIVGFGKMGYARMKAVKGAPEGANLYGIVSRRARQLSSGSTVAAGKIKCVTINEALASDGAEAFIVCVENDKHFKLAKKILEAGKHLCMENPLALSVEDGRTLFDIAEKTQSVLHVQHIDALSTAHQLLKSTINDKLRNGVRLRQVEVGYMGGVLPQSWGTLPFTGISRLHIIQDLLQTINLRLKGVVYQYEQDAVLRPDDDIENAEKMTVSRPAATMQSGTGTNVLWTEWRAPGLKPRTTYRLKFSDGTEINGLPKVANRMPVFLQDLDIFLQKCRGETDFDSGRNIILWALETANAIQWAGEMRGHFLWSERLSHVRFGWKDEQTYRLDLNDKEHRPLYFRAASNDREREKLSLFDSQNFNSFAEDDEDDY